MTELSDTFDEVARLVTNLFGQSMTFSREAQGAYNPATGRTGPPVVTNYAAMGAPVDYRDSEIDGTIIRRGDTRIYIHNVPGLVPAPGDLVMNFRGGNWRVINVEVYPVNAVDDAYGLQVRR